MTIKPKNTTEILKNESNSIHKLGLKLVPLSAQEINQYRVPGGVKVVKIEDGIIARNTKIKPGFVITSINDISVKSESELSSILNAKNGSKVVLDGFYPDTPYIVRYEFIY